MPYVWRYIGSCLKPADLPSGVLDEWETTLKAEQTRIKSSLDTKIPNEAAFLSRIADASSDQYEQFLATVGAMWDVNMIELKQRVKLAARYPEWDAGIEAAFGVGGYFPDRVTSKKAKFKLARFVLGAVGHRPTVGGDFGVWNPVTMGILLLRGDKRPFRYFDANDSIAPSEAAHEAALQAVLGSLVSPSIIARAVQGVLFAKYADDGGKDEAWIDTNIITPFNATIATLIGAAKISGYTVSYTLDWVPAGKNVDIIAELTSKP